MLPSNAGFPSFMVSFQRNLPKYNGYSTLEAKAISLHCTGGKINILAWTIQTFSFNKLIIYDYKRCPPLRATASSHPFFLLPTSPYGRQTSSCSSLVSQICQTASPYAHVQYTVNNRSPRIGLRLLPFLHGIPLHTRSIHTPEHSTKQERSYGELLLS